jgi:hypothetical protein
MDSKNEPKDKTNNNENKNEEKPQYKFLGKPKNLGGKKRFEPMPLAKFDK